MDFRKYLKDISLVVCLLSSAGSAQALSIEVKQMVSAWNNVIIGIPNTLTGVGSSKIQWGLSTNGGDHSAFSFSNTSNSMSQLNSPFSLGEFTYLNSLVTGANPESAKLRFDAVFDIDGTTVSGNSFDVDFDLHQIPGKCGKAKCTRDLVKLKNTEDLETFVVGGMVYTLNIVGFMTDSGLKTVLQTDDDSVSSAELVGVFTATAIAEPGTLGLALVGFAVMYSSRRRPVGLRRQDR